MTPLLLLLLVATQSILTVKNSQNTPQYPEITVLKSQRTVGLSGDYPEEINKLVLTAENEAQHYYHIIPADLANNVADIRFEFRKLKLKFSREQSNDGSIVYKVQFGEPLTDTPREITVTTYYINRYKNLPSTISLTDDQKLVYTDYLSFYSPYSVNTQSTTYKFMKVVDYSAGGQKSGIAGIKYSSSAIGPYNLTKVSVHGVNNKPQMVFTYVEKVIQISHWGNIAILEKYSILNKGPSLKGEFSRVEYNPGNPTAGRTALQSLKASLPYETWGLFYRDEVGNVTTSKAFRSAKNGAVFLQIEPRFGILGSWRSNWEIGYNLPAENFLKSQGNNFQTSDLNLGYVLDSVFAEQYTLKIILPEGAENYKVKLSGRELQYSTSLTFSYLDFKGRPTLELRRGKTGKNSEKDIKISYEYSVEALLVKPLLVFTSFFGLFTVLIVAGRMELKSVYCEEY